MKGLVWVLLMVCSLSARASDALLVPLFTPKPEFPEQLLKERYSGKVFAHITIGNTGIPRAARIIESSHAKFSEAAIETLGQWRFAAWQANQGRPEEVEITLPIIFGALGLKSFSSEVTVGLENTTCAYLNYEVRASRKDYPAAPLSEVDVFWYHRYYLSSTYVAYQAPDQGARQRLYSALQKAIPVVVRGCAGNASGKYGDYLPAELRSVSIL